MEKVKYIHIHVEGDSGKRLLFRDRATNQGEKAQAICEAASHFERELTENRGVPKHPARTAAQVIVEHERAHARNHRGEAIVSLVADQRGLQVQYQSVKPLTRIEEINMLIGPRKDMSEYDRIAAGLPQRYNSSKPKRKRFFFF